MSPKEVLEFARKKEIRQVDLRFTDLPGVQQHVSYPIGELSESSVALIPVKVSNSEEERRAPEVVVPAAGGAIHIELPGRAVISVESGADPTLLRTLLESLRQ